MRSDAVKRAAVPANAAEVDYSAARAQAIKWLGDRYLLAKPINRNPYARRSVPPSILRSTPIEVPPALMPQLGH